MIQEDALLDFAAVSFKSVWALELLLVFKREPARAWEAEEIIRELRSSRGVVAKALSNLMAAQLAVQDETGRYRYQAGAADLDAMVAGVERLYAAKPTAVIRAIMAPSNGKRKSVKKPRGRGH